jgi:hypothetical protein
MACLIHAVYDTMAISNGMTAGSTVALQWHVRVALCTYVSVALLLRPDAVKHSLHGGHA